MKGIIIPNPIMSITTTRKSMMRALLSLPSSIFRSRMADVIESPLKLDCEGTPSEIQALLRGL